MSKLAAGLEAADFGPNPHKGPRGECFAVYGDCDLEDFKAIERLKNTGLTWTQLQEQVDQIMGIESPIPVKKFTYHWRGLCSCWRDKNE